MQATHEVLFHGEPTAYYYNQPERVVFSKRYGGVVNPNWEPRKRSNWTIKELVFNLENE